MACINVPKTPTPGRGHRGPTRSDDNLGRVAGVGATSDPRSALTAANNLLAKQSPGRNLSVRHPMAAAAEATSKQLAAAQSDFDRATTRVAIEHVIRKAEAAVDTARRANVARETLHELESKLAALKDASKARLQRDEPPLGAAHYGAARHKAHQLDDRQWAETQGLDSKANKYVKKDDGMRGFMDHITWLDASHTEALITEYKTIRFDRKTPSQLHREVEGIIDQVNGYRLAESLGLGQTQTLVQIDERPTTPDYAEYIEQRFAEEMINVIFLDE
jgi:hypothetical protein